ncbi:hypothetical protein BDW71DRAFT_180113, partial [Aspergillus fruticulosus]
MTTKCCAYIEPIPSRVQVLLVLHSMILLGPVSFTYYTSFRSSSYSKNKQGL